MADVISNLHTLLRGLPYGEAQYVRDQHVGNWRVCLFEEGSTLRIMTLATGMDKNVACFFANSVNEAMKKLYQGRTLHVEKE